MNLVFFDGNSLTQSRGGVTAYPDLIDMRNTPSANVSVGGATTPQQDARAVTAIDPQYRPGYNNWVVLWEGANDLYFGATATEAMNHFRDYCAHRRAAGFKVALVTLLPRSDSGRPQTYEASRMVVNDRLRTAWAATEFFDHLIDVALDPHMGHAGQEFDGRYYLPDLVHLNGAGAQTIAGMVASELALLGLL